MLTYLRLCLAASASMVPSLDILNQPELMSATSCHYIEQLVIENGPITSYIELALELLAANPSKVPLECILQVVAGVPKLAPVVLSKLDVFKTLQNHRCPFLVSEASLKNLSRNPFKPKIFSIEAIESLIYFLESFKKLLDALQE